MVNSGVIPKMSKDGANSPSAEAGRLDGLVEALIHASGADRGRREDAVRTARAQLMECISKLLDEAEEAARLPQDPSAGLLMSMAIRFDHGLGLPGYYDAGFLRGVATHAQKLESTLRTMKQLYEEVIGKGFYSKELEAHYAQRMAEGLTTAGSSRAAANGGCAADASA